MSPPLDPMPLLPNSTDAPAVVAPPICSDRTLRPAAPWTPGPEQLRSTTAPHERTEQTGCTTDSGRAADRFDIETGGWGS
jgi:hypothetical protein